MKTITNLSQIKNINGKIYVRWSKSIDLDNTRGYSLRYGTQAEAGLSACEIDPTWEDWRILRQVQEYAFLGGSCWIVTGEEIGLGGDDEPLLKNLQIIGKVSNGLLSTDWRMMEIDVDIADCRERLTRITDPIGRKIVEQHLDKLLSMRK